MGSVDRGQFSGQSETGEKEEKKPLAHCVPYSIPCNYVANWMGKIV